MKGKKLILMALAVALTLSIAVPSILAGSETVIAGSYEEIPIEVVIMPEGTATINPYKMPVKVYSTQPGPNDADGKPTKVRIGNKTLTTAGKIATQPLVMYNMTDVDLNVGATVTASGVSGVELLTSALPVGSTDKQAVVYLEAKQENQYLDGTTYKVNADTTTIGTVDGEALLNAFNDWTPTTLADSSKKVVVNPDDPAKGKELATMVAADMATGQPKKGGYVLYRLAGDCVEEPETAWRTSDKFNVKIAFTFTPVTAP